MIWRWAVVLWLVAVRIGSAADCNQNEIPDRDDIQSGTSADCNGNLRPDECDMSFDIYWLRIESPVFQDVDPLSLVFADLNKDRLPDAAAVPLGSSSVLVKLRAPDYRNVDFEEETRLYDVPPSPGILVAGDVDGDQLRDLVVGHRGSPEISVLSGNGSGDFSGPRSWPVGVIPAAILVEDLDGELGPDVAALGSAPPTVSILWNRNNFGLSSAVLHALPMAAASSRPTALASADLDRDGDRDLIVAGANDGPAVALWNLGFRRFRLEEIPVRGESIAALEMNSDLHIDIAASGPSATRIYGNSGAGSFFLSNEFFAGKSPGDLALGSALGGWRLAAAGDRIGIITRADTVTSSSRIAELFDSVEEIGPFLALVSSDSSYLNNGETVLAALGTELRNEAIVLRIFRSYDPTSRDCNRNGVPDECDIASGEEDDCDGNGWADSCEPDCNGNGVLDLCDIDLSTSADCNRDRIPDECPTFHASWTGRDADDDGILDHCDEDNPYELRFVGPTNLRSADGVATADFFVEIVDGAAASAIQGFSYGVRAEGCTITRATVEGTPLFRLPQYLAGFRGGAERPYLPPVECIWSYSGVALDGAMEAHQVLRLTVSCPRAEGSPCSSGVLDFSPTCFYTSNANCWIELEDGYRLPLLTPRPFTICLGDFRRGDANSDGKVDISDGIRTAMYLFLGASAPPCLDAADATDDGAHDISDAIRILMDFFIPQDTNIPAPGPFECGPDPSPDDIGCDSPPAC